MGNTGNSDTYPYGIRFTRDKEQVYNRITGETVESFELHGIEASQKLNDLVDEFKAATEDQKAVILGEAQAAA